MKEDGITENLITFYPNPTSTQITIEFANTITPSKNTTLTIFNINGQQLLMQRVTQQQTVVDVNGLSQGVYLVRVADDRTMKVGKFVKQ